MITLTVLMMIILCTPLYKSNAVNKMRAWLKKKLLWNFILRMILESSIIMNFCFALTLLYGKWERIGGIINMLSAWTLGLITLILPFFILIFYLIKYDTMNSEDEDIANEFDEKWGAPLEGLNKSQKSSVAQPVMFLLRRTFFVIISIWLFSNLIAQLALQILMTVIKFAYLIQFQPFEDRLVQKLEIFNEIMLILIIDVMFCFTDIIPTERDKQLFGYVFIILITVTIGVHLVNLVLVTVANIKNAYK